MLQILIGQVANSSRVSSKVQNHDARATSLVSVVRPRAKNASRFGPFPDRDRHPHALLRRDDDDDNLAVQRPSEAPFTVRPPVLSPLRPSVRPSSPQDSLFGLC